MTSVCDVHFQSLWDHTSHEVWNAIGYMSLELGAWRGVYFHCRYWSTNKYLGDLKTEAYPFDLIHS